MSHRVCRTCLTVITENSQSFFTLENGMPGTITFREKLNCCIPELALDIIPSAVICSMCSTTLNLAYDFKTKCLEVEAKVRNYLQDANDNYSNVNHIVYSSQRKSSICLDADADHKLQTSSSKSFEDLKQEQEYEDLQEEPNEGRHEDSVTETNNSHIDTDENEEYELLNGFMNTRISKIKTENHSNEELPTANGSELVQNDLNNTTFQSYLLKSLEKLKDKNINKSTAYDHYDQVWEQFNLLKTMQTLACQGTEINISSLGISCPNNAIAKYSEHSLLKKSSADEEQIQNSSKQKKTLECYDCYYCSRSFDRLSLLKTHTISHTGVKPFTCNICGKGCSHKGELNNHMRTHTGEKPFKCNLCESSFSQISNMKIHMRTHTGEKPYKCDYCEKSFSHKCGVKVHMRTHTGERPYKCEVCFKTYTHKKDLDDHMRTHTGEKYKCTICSKEITYKKNLSAHMITHSLKNGNKQSILKKSKVLKYCTNLTYSDI